MNKVDGRPVKRGVPLKFWTPRHDQVVALYLSGWKNPAIAQETGYDTHYISDIIADPRAQRIIDVARRRFITDALTAIGDRMSLLGIQAIENIAKTIEDKTFEAGTKAKRHQDAVSFELLARVGFGKKEVREDGTGLKMTKEGEERLLSAIEKSNRAREIIVETKESNGRQLEAGDVEPGED